MSKQQQLEFLLRDCADVLAKNSIESLAKLKNKTIYIAGGTGFVGTWVATLVDYLNQHHSFNTKLYILSRHSDAFQQMAPHLQAAKEIELISKDVRNVFELPNDVNYVLHLACSPDSRSHISNPLDTASIIADGTKNLLSVARYCPKLENILYLSSASIYGHQALSLSNIAEDFLGSAPKPTLITSTYAEAKRYAELLCTIFRSQYRLPIVIARPFAFVGPFQSLERPWAINNFMHDALQDKPVNVLGDGKTIRSYLYGSDVAYWVLNMLANAASGETYNLGSDQEIDLIDLANLIAVEAQSEGKVSFADRTTMAPQASRLVPAIERAKIDLKLKVTVDLKAAISKTLEWNHLCKL
ncbi:MAG: NAD-dependent epimerase/dehydratase family protein [Gammaproteobacteria bacterium]|nr:NAD-dependent epimerase/dehydratase family protein [Gammaproteobacteria bacterium]